MGFELKIVGWIVGCRFRLAAAKLFGMWWPGTELNRRRQPFQGIEKGDVVFWFKDKQLSRRVEMRCSLEDFVERLSQHVPEYYQHAVRNFGLFAPRGLSETTHTIFAILRQKHRPRPKARGWAESIKRDFRRDPLLDREGKRMKWVGRIAPRGSE